tara:strand:+ start:1609 stop:2271 length:663 start_codon:yes stop_codon:yes gene_type:complete
MRKPVKKRGNNNATKVTTGSKKEAKHHREVMKAAVKVDYEAGILTRSQICEKYGFWQSTLTKYVNAGNWQYASKREQALTSMHTRMIQKYADDRANISHQHLDELNNLKEKVLNSKDAGELSIWSAKADTVMKIIRSERIALAMPNEYKYIEQKNENVYRVEDALKELNTQMGSNVIEGEIIAESNTQPIKMINHAKNNKAERPEEQYTQTQENTERAEA